MGHNGDAVKSEQFEKMMGRVGKHVDARTVFGEPTIVGDRAMIPVAKVSYGGGGGWGSGQGPADEETGADAAELQGEGEGMGMGFGVTAKPLGAYEVTAEGVHWAPVFDWSRLVMIWSVVSGFVVIVAALKWLFSRSS